MLGENQGMLGTNPKKRCSKCRRLGGDSRSARKQGVVNVQCQGNARGEPGKLDVLRDLGGDGVHPQNEAKESGTGVEISAAARATKRYPWISGWRTISESC